MKPAFDLAVEHDHPVYDTLFIALAQREGLRVATFDRRMLDRFPAWAFEPKARKR
jgi:predicted nucleic acid-binding protein